jgi:cytochrome P450
MPDESRGPVQPPAELEARICQWSLYQPWLQQDPVRHWKEIRDHGPILRSDEANGYWILTSYADIEWAAKNPEIFSSAHVSIPHRDLFPVKQIPIQLDGEEHRRWRQTLSELFNPAVVNHFTPQIRQATIDAIDPVANKGHCEFIAEVATRLPAETFLITFGIGREYLQQLLDHKTWLRQVGLPNAHTAEQLHEANRPLWEFFSDSIDRRRRDGIEGRRDVLSRLLGATFDGRALTQDEMINAAFVSMLASLDTTTSALGLIFQYLAEHAEVQKLIAGSPDRIPGIVEELIRHEPVSTTARVVTRDVERHGITLRAGDRVLMSWGMAGLDPDVFERPDEVDFDRASTRHLAFAVGPHRCLGMHLARRVIALAVEEWHARVPRYEPAEGTCPARGYSPSRHVRALELTYD